MRGTYRGAAFPGGHAGFQAGMIHTSAEKRPLQARGPLHVGTYRGAAFPGGHAGFQTGMIHTPAEKRPLQARGPLHVRVAGARRLT